MPLIRPEIISIEGAVVKSQSRRCKSSANSIDVCDADVGCQESKLSCADEYEKAIHKLDLLIRDYVQLVNKDMDSIVTVCEKFEDADKECINIVSGNKLYV